MKYVRALGLGAAASVLCAPNAMAQAVDWTGTVRAKVTYDSAASRSTEALAEARGLEQSDVIGDILATFDINKGFGRQKAFLRGSVGYDFHKRNTELDRERMDISAGVDRPIGSCNVNLTGIYQRSQSDLEEIGLEAVKNLQELRTIKTGVSCAPIIGIAPSVQVSQDWSDNSAETRQASNFDSLSASVALGYNRPALGSVSIFGEYRETTFSNRLVLVDGELLRDGFETYSAGVRYSRALGTRLQGSVSAGYTSVNPDIPGVEGYNGVTYGADLNYKPTGRLSTSLAFSRDTKPSNRLDSTYAVADAYVLQATYSLGQRISLSLGGRYRNNQIEGAVLTPGVDISAEEVRGVFGAVNMQLNRRISLKLDASRDERNADVNGFDYVSERVGLTAIAGF